MAAVLINPALRATSAINKAIYSQLDRRRWTSLTDLVLAAAPHITEEKAIEVFNDRLARPKRIYTRNERLVRGRRMKVLLDCITLVATGKIEQRGRGDTKEYRLKRVFVQRVIATQSHKQR